MTSDGTRTRFATVRVARLATASAGGVRHLVPIVFAGPSRSCVQRRDAKPKRTAALRRLANVRANPCVPVLIDHYDEDWSALWWAGADGRARARAQDDEAHLAVALFRARYPQQRATGAVLRSTCIAGPAGPPLCDRRNAGTPADARRLEAKPHYILLVSRRDLNAEALTTMCACDPTGGSPNRQRGRSISPACGRSSSPGCLHARGQRVSSCG